MTALNWTSPKLTHVVTTISAASALGSVCVKSAAQDIPCMDPARRCSSVSQVQERQGGRSCTGSRKAVLFGACSQAAASTGGQETAAPTGEKAAAAAHQKAAAPQVATASATEGAREDLCYLRASNKSTSPSRVSREQADPATRAADGSTRGSRMLRR